MIVKSDRLIFRFFKTDDFEKVHSYSSLPLFSQYDSWGPNSEQDTKNYLTKCIMRSQEVPVSQYELAVCLKSDEMLIGSCSLRGETAISKTGSLGFAISPQFQNQGYATELTKKLIEFGFEELGFSIIYATCDTRNEASLKVLEKSGMTRVGTIKSHKVIRGQARDSYRYEVSFSKK